MGHANATGMTIIHSRAAAGVGLTSLAFGSSGCKVIGGIFKAGVWVGALGVVAVLALIVWGISAALRQSR